MGKVSSTDKLSNPQQPSCTTLVWLSTALQCLEMHHNTPCPSSFPPPHTTCHTTTITKKLPLFLSHLHITHILYLVYSCSTSGQPRQPPLTTTYTNMLHTNITKAKMTLWKSCLTQPTSHFESRLPLRSSGPPFITEPN
ncbi:hypothetical protein E2C01_079099 [Portunus trituberculatus]|uniref:Uncharacterized protein n=1 Tax=Portunus trituberculatus TaxID=210409 RepID=A0A5B7IG35_PORTR|nr:hypothetical protein [Portunus trituberculatus]